MEKETFTSEKEEILRQLTLAPAEALFQQADYVRGEFCGEEVHIRGIIEFSNHCCRSCLYCGLRRENKNILRYRIAPGEIIETSQQAIRQGVRTIVLQSGDDLEYSREALCGIISKIKSAHPETAVTLSLGERPPDDYKAFRDAGADRYLLKHETANPGLYPRLHPGQSLEKRIEILEYLKELGYQTGAGSITGLPGQTAEDIAEDILFLKKLDVDMAGIGPFIPQQDTPLKDSSPGDLGLSLKALALARLFVRDIHLPATTALATLSPAEGQVLGLKAGANVIMPDFTPERYRCQYRIYDGKKSVDLETAKSAIRAAKRKISIEKGDSLKCKPPQKAFACI